MGFYPPFLGSGQKLPKFVFHERKSGNNQTSTFFPHKNYADLANKYNRNGKYRLKYTRLNFD